MLYVKPAALDCRKRATISLARHCCGAQIRKRLERLDKIMDNKSIFEAIVLRKCIDATYNRAAVKLAPHIMYTKHGELFLDAVTVERDGRPPRGE